MHRGFLNLIKDETAGFDLRWHLAKFFMLPIPQYTGGRIRAQLMRGMGFQIGRGTMIWDTPQLIGGKDLHTKIHIGDFCLITLGCYLDLAAPIKLGNHVGLSPQTMLLTGMHDINNPKNRVGRVTPRPVTICDGVWLGSRCVVLPGVTVGEGAIVAAGAVVTKDVAPHTLVGGVPAATIKELPRGIWKRKVYPSLRRNHRSTKVTSR